MKKIHIDNEVNETMHAAQSEGAAVRTETVVDLAQIKKRDTKR